MLWPHPPASVEVVTDTSTSLTGRALIAGESIAGTGSVVHAVDPSTGATLEPGYAYLDAKTVAHACDLAAEAFAVYRTTTAPERARFLEAIADRITAGTDEIVARAVQESGLPEGRISGEVVRTTGQLRLFAAVLREGSWNGARIDPAQPDRTPLPRPDIRQRTVPLGPVAVFAASNFPLAFSVAGGDTASALAAGCPVVVKAHDAHPGTCELVGRAVADAVAECGLPAGTFSLLFLDGPTDAPTLVQNPAIRAVGFTGSRRAGLALCAAAACRPMPIPVYAEMSSVNPAFLLPAALAERAEAIAAGYVGSLTLGAGQFCTNPGLVFAVDGADLDRFVSTAAGQLTDAPAAPMLTAGIAAAYRAGVERLAGATRQVVPRGDAGDHDGRPALFTIDSAAFRADPALQDEVFGAAGLVVGCGDTADLIDIVADLDGQLTGTVHAGTDDLDTARALVTELELRVGRILFDSWPTGVEVGHAMVHGGPFPATSDSRTTSVGSRAIERFLRPVAYQDVPADLLPSAVADGNPDGIWRRVDGELTR